MKKLPEPSSLVAPDVLLVLSRYFAPDGLECCNPNDADCDGTMGTMGWNSKANPA